MLYKIFEKLTLLQNDATEFHNIIINSMIAQCGKPRKQFHNNIIYLFITKNLCLLFC